MSRQTCLAVILALCIAALKIESGHALTPCGPGTAPADPDDGGCYACVAEHCADCGTTDYNGNCVACATNYGFAADGTTCTPCGTDCQNCGASADTCEQCAFSNYGPELGSSPQSCAACSSNCGGCMSTGAGNCDYCNAKFAFDGSHQCQPCSPPTCVSCFTNGPYQCDDCVPGYGKDNTPGAKAPICKLCEPANCATCFGDFQHCDLCLDGSSADTTTGHCSPIAPRILYKSDWGGLFQKAFKVVPWRTKCTSCVIVHVTNSKCTNCQADMKAIQKNQMFWYKNKNGKQMNYDDINWSHVICPNGDVLSGRGWNYVTNPRPGYALHGCAEVALCGKYRMNPTAEQVTALDNYIQHAKPYTLCPNAEVIGDYDNRCRRCPGKATEALVMARSDYGGQKMKNCPPYSRGASRSSRK